MESKTLDERACNPSENGGCERLEFKSPEIGNIEVDVFELNRFPILRSLAEGEIRTMKCYARVFSALLLVMLFGFTERALAVGPAGTLYGYMQLNGSQQLVSIDPATGVIKPLTGIDGEVAFAGATLGDQH